MKAALITLFTLILIITFYSCNHDEEYMGEGVITGYDPRDCACCGGLLINLNSSSTDLFSDSTYQIDKVPGNFPIDGNTIFPVFIRLDYERTNALCGKTIDITRFELR